MSHSTVTGTLDCILPRLPPAKTLLSESYKYIEPLSGEPPVTTVTLNFDGLYPLAHVPISVRSNW